MINVSPVVDFRTDAGHQMLNQIAAKHELPAYVLTVPVPSTGDSDDGTSKLASEDSNSSYSCALLQPQPRFPTDTKAACWLSHAYYIQQMDKLSREEQQSVERFLRGKAAFWGIESDVHNIVVREAEVIKQANTCNDAYPVRSQDEATAASKWLLAVYREKRASQIHIEDRIDLASRIVDYLPASLSADDESLLWKAACRRGCYNGNKVAGVISTAMQSRVGDKVHKLAKTISQLTGRALQAQHKAAAIACDQFNVFGDQPAELALAVDTAQPVVILPSGSVVTKEAADRFRSVDTVLYREEKGHLDKLAWSAVLSSMDEETADQYEQRMADSGVPFVTRHLPDLHVA